VGTKEKAIKKVVLDTNILISSLLFKGTLSRIVDLWKDGKILPVISRETFHEFKTVLEYPKFKLTKGETKAIIEEEILPFFEIVEITNTVSGICKDPDDDKFIACALSASADFIVSGDKDLCDVVTHKSIKIISASHLLKIID
jgi:putative PIN family toxin of toxin-antitoxin system